MFQNVLMNLEKNCILAYQLLSSLLIQRLKQPLLSHFTLLTVYLCQRLLVFLFNFQVVVAHL
ncbi:unknown [Salmonella phage FelixO1]|uniref:Uncharacterized protein n=1 Tax=Salmonella phage Felix O1 (isolate Felix O1-VT1) TaxID=1283336 RepID=Q6KGG6_BPFO1|nr:unknown [Salmonella phage FelixO1]